MSPSPHPAEPFVVREANEIDGPAVADVFERAFRPVRSVYRPTEQTLAAQNDRRVETFRLVCETGGKIVGTVEFDLHDDHLHLVGMAIHPEFQRCGIARRLLNWGVDKAYQTGRRHIELATIRETGNATIFNKLGFQVVHADEAQWCMSDIHETLHNVTMRLWLR